MKDIYSYMAQQLAEPPKETQQDQPQSNPFGSFGLLMMGGVFLLMYFLLIYPQRKEEKRKKKMLATLQKGDPVVTNSGIIGTVASVKEKSIFVNVGDGTRIEFLRSAISQVPRSDSNPSRKRDEPARS